MPSTRSPRTPQAPPGGVGREDLVDAFLAASRALVAVAARSLTNLSEDVTLSQYRVLVELAARGPQRLVELSGILGVDASTATRMCDRLVRKRLVQRRRASSDRRGVLVSLQPAGRRFVDEVSTRCHAEIARILESLPQADLDSVFAALKTFAEATGRVPEQDWSRGWHALDSEPVGNGDG